jgi:pimeloyl-ACP methyl ester carboxylesterase
LLLITGIGASIDIWAPFARLMADRELIAFDAPGAGMPSTSSPPPGDRHRGRVGRGLPRRLCVTTLSAFRRAI